MQPGWAGLSPFPFCLPREGEDGVALWIFKYICYLSRTLNCEFIPLQQSEIKVGNFKAFEWKTLLLENIKTPSLKVPSRLFWS